LKRGIHSVEHDGKEASILKLDQVEIVKALPINKVKTDDIMPKERYRSLIRSPTSR
jgi:hypothetical protein